jgi:ABC-2 type transport system permease protein
MNMQAKLPKSTAAFAILLKADFITQWRNRRSLLMALLVPVMLLLSWKGAVDKLGAPFILSMSLTIGLTSIGIMGYAITQARDRDKGVFQRLRVTPVPVGLIMLSRIFVQLAMIILVTLLVFYFGYKWDGILLSLREYIFSFIASIIGGALYLGLGQMIVGFVKNAETVNAATRLVYIGFIVLGIFGESGLMGEKVKNIIHWSPFGTVKTILSAGMVASSWSPDIVGALIATLLYALLFGILGVKWFRWSGSGR